MIQREDPLRSFRRMQNSAVLVPLALLCILALGLSVAIRLLLSASEKAAQSDRVIALAERNRKLLIDEETGLRGYMLSGDRAFLEPLENARRDLPSVQEELLALLGGDPELTARYQAIQRLAGEWAEFARGQLGRAARIAQPETRQDDLRGKQKMDQIRGAADELINAETAHAKARASEVRALGRWILLGTLAWTFVVGLVLAYFSRGHLRSLAVRYEASLAEALQQAEEAKKSASKVQSLNVRLEQRVAERTASLKAANTELEAFSYSVSHDLRAPLRHVAGFVQMLARTAAPKLDEKERHYLETITGSARQAGQLIDDLLSFSRMTRANLQWARVDTGALAREVQRELSQDAAGRDVRWSFGSLPEVRGDREMLHLLFVNLLSNALKYTRARSPAEIEVGSTRRDDGSIVFSVRDNGVGFDMRYAGKLFGPFQRLHRSDEFEGTGIGLANVRRIVLRHGGEVWAEAAPDRGATFSFSLPAQAGMVHSRQEAGDAPAHPAPEAHA